MDFPTNLGVESGKQHNSLIVCVNLRESAVDFPILDNITVLPLTQIGNHWVYQ